MMNETEFLLELDNKTDKELYARITALTLEGQYTFIIAYAYARGNATRAEVSLRNTHRTAYRFTPRLVSSQIFTLYLLHPYREATSLESSAITPFESRAHLP